MVTHRMHAQRRYCTVLSSNDRASVLRGRILCRRSRSPRLISPAMRCGRRQSNLLTSEGVKSNGDRTLRARQRSTHSDRLKGVRSARIITLVDLCGEWGSSRAGRGLPVSALVRVLSLGGWTVLRPERLGMRVWSKVLRTPGLPRVGHAVRRRDFWLK